jgi:membrane protease YdiL (CAAX protease family)
MLAGNEILLIAGPALVAAWLGRYRWRETFAFRKTTPRALLGGLLLGLGTMPWIQAASNFQAQFWKPDPEVAKATMKLMLPTLVEHPILAAILVGLLAGICEEILYRGPLQTALARRLSMWPTLLIGGALFSAVHMDLHGFAYRMLLGMILGWLVYRGGSILPAMLMHAVFDLTAMLATAYEIHKTGADKYMQLATSHNPSAVDDVFPMRLISVALVVGGAMILAGFLLCRADFRSRDAQLTPEPAA